MVLSDREYCVVPAFTFCLPASLPMFTLREVRSLNTLGKTPLFRGIPMSAALLTLLAILQHRFRVAVRTRLALRPRKGWTESHITRASANVLLPSSFFPSLREGRLARPLEGIIQIGGSVGWARYSKCTNTEVCKKHSEISHQ